MTDPHDREGILAAATDRLLATVDTLTDADVREPSLLPGWTRGHVLTHVARNADAMGNLVTWARTGVETPAYPSRESRDADIERGAARPVGEHRRDLAAAADRLAEQLRTLPEDRLDTLVGTAERGVPARSLAWRRLREVEIHHMDLRAGYTRAGWPMGFVSRCLDDVVDAFAERPDTPPMTLRAAETSREWTLGDGSAGPTVGGPERLLLAWLLGRGDGEDLVVVPSGPLPRPPAWA